MKQRWIVRVFGVLLVVLIVVAGFGQAVLHLWNWLMPTLFGLQALTFGQALGLLGLSWILFGGWRGFQGPTRRWRGGGGRWEEMTPEQRTKLREAIEGRHGRCTTAPSAAAEPRPDCP